MKLKWLKKLIVPTSLVTLTTAIAISCGAPVADDKKDGRKKTKESKIIQKLLQILVVRL